MPEEILSLAADFPPVPTAAWEAAIRADLKGADYEKKLVWRTEDGIPVRPYYRAEDIANLPVFPCRASGHTWEIAQEGVPPWDRSLVFYHVAGSTAVQELAFAVFMGVSNLRMPGTVPPKQMPFLFPIGPYYFVEIAKFRAMRLLWANVTAAFGVECPLRLAAITTSRNKSVYDRYTNLLRATTEALSAIIGGCDVLTVDPFGFDPHLALNLQRILKEEAHLDAVADPAGGSYYIESLTAALARDAWKLFQQFEVEGLPAFTARVKEARAEREKAVSSRRRTLVGVNNYPNLSEKTPGFELPIAGGCRLAEPFETIRARTTRLASEKGAYPKVLLLKRGDLKMRMARANFCLNFFGCAGFDIVESEELAAADLIILCSSDPEYLALAREICPQTAAPVLVAGNPKDQIEALKAAGVQGFVHMQSDAVQTLTEWQNRIAAGRNQ
ncbi:MAG TPA: methylmalonyl-CoA mutase family protein [Bryobacteraceae bacterium]|nr:methylmalonyl-CoA mutase family protein [Bryobacteraceae bacterium]